MWATSLISPGGDSDLSDNGGIVLDLAVI